MIKIIKLKSQIIFFFILFSITNHIFAADYVVGTGITQSTTQTLATGDTITINGTLSNGTAIDAWNYESSANTDLTITNNGSVSGTLMLRGARRTTITNNSSISNTSINFKDANSWTINNAEGASITGGATTIGCYRCGGGTINNYGTIDSSSSHVITDINGVTINNFGTGTLSSSSNPGTMISYNNTINNYGTISSDLGSSGQALYLFGDSNVVNIYQGSSITGLITDLARTGRHTVKFHNTGAHTHSNNIELDGNAGSALYQTGAGTTILSGTNTYAGGTYLENGFLQLGSAQPIGTSGTIHFNGGGLKFSDSNSTDYSSRFSTAASQAYSFDTNSQNVNLSNNLTSSGGSLTKTGSGTLTLSGSNTYSGITTISAGTLKLTGSLNTSTDVTANGTFDVDVNQTISALSGSGNVEVANSKTLTINDDLKPGNSIGTLTVSGDIALANSSTTEIEINPSSNDKLVTTGDITLDGTLSIKPEAGTYSAGRYTLFDGSSGSGNSLTGTFDTVSYTNESRFGDYILALEYDTTSRQVVLVLTNSRTGYKARIPKAKLSAIAEILENINTRGNKTSLTTSLDNLSDTELEKALRQIKGITVQKSIGQSVKSNSNFRRAMTNALSSKNSNLVRNNFADISISDYLNFNSFNNASTEFNQNNFTFKDIAKIYNNRNLLSFGSAENEIFLRTFGGLTDQDKVGSDIGYSSSTAGFIFGSLNKISNNLNAGWGLGFSTNGLDYDEGYGLNNTHSLHANFFADKAYNTLKTHFSIGSFLSKNHSTRNITEVSTQTLKSTNYDLGFDAKIDITKTLNLFNWELTPLASITSSYVVQDDIDESGGDLALKIKTDNLFLIKPELGLSLDRNISNLLGKSRKLSFSVYGSKEEKLDGSDSRATIKDTGDGYALIDNNKSDKFLTSGLSYISSNELNNSMLNLGIFVTQNEQNNMNSGLLSFNYQKKF